MAANGPARWASPDGLARRNALPDNGVVPKKPAGGLRNTIYEQQTRSSRRLTESRLFAYKMLVPVGIGLLRMVWRWCRVVRVSGVEHITDALARAPSFIPVYWHQHQLFCVKQLLELRRAGVKLGFLISPSVDGELAAMLVTRGRRGGDSRLLELHRRAGAARLLPGARATGHLSRHHARWTARPAVEVQTGGDLAFSIVAAADHSHGVRCLARLEDQVGPLRHPHALGPDRNGGRGAGHRCEGLGCRRPCAPASSRWREFFPALYGEAKALLDRPDGKPQEYKRLACIPDNLCENSPICIRESGFWELCDTFDFWPESSGKLLIHNRIHDPGTPQGAWR